MPLSPSVRRNSARIFCKDQFFGRKCLKRFERIFHVRLAGILGAVLFLTSCTASREYLDLDAGAETNPSKDRIVGMWHQRKNDFDGGRLRMSMLIQSQGTGMVDSSYIGILGTNNTSFDSLGNFTWNYAGNGIWKLHSTTTPGLVDECKISNGFLLRRLGGVMPFARYLIYERIAVQ